MILDIMNNYKEALNDLKRSIIAIDKKAGIMLSAAMFIITATSIMKDKMDNIAFLFFIVFICISLIFFIISVLPIIKIGKESKDNPLYIINIKVKKDNSFLKKEPTEEHLVSQIQKVRLILRLKYIFFYIGISFLFISLISIMVGIFI